MCGNHIAAVTALLTAAPATAQLVPEVSEPVPIHAPGSFAKYRIDSLDVACDSRGQCVVIGSAQLSGSRDDNIWISRSGDGGRTWSDPLVFPDEFQNGEILPQIATDGQGYWLAWWMDSSARCLMVRSEDDGVTWSQPAPFVGVRRFAPRLGVDAAGVWAAVWQADVEIGRSGPEGEEAVFASDILISRSFDHGGTWSEPVSLNLRTGTEPDREDQEPYVLSNGSVWLTVWSSGDSLGETIGKDPDILSRRSTDGGGEWSDIQVLNSNAGDSSADGDGRDGLPQLATDGSDRWLAVWRTDLSSPTVHTRYFIARSADNGATWSDRASFDYVADLAADSCGNWLATWPSAAEPPTVTEPLDGGPPPPVRDRRDGEIVITHSHDAGLTWTAPFVLNSDAEDETDDDVIPRLAAFGDGKWIAVWIRQGDDVNKVMAARFEFPPCGDAGDEQNGMSTGSSDETAQTAACPAVAALLVAVAVLGMRVSSKGLRRARDGRSGRLDLPYGRG